MSTKIVSEYDQEIPQSQTAKLFVVLSRYIIVFDVIENHVNRNQSRLKIKENIIICRMKVLCLCLPKMIKEKVIDECKIVIGFVPVRRHWDFALKGYFTDPFFPKYNTYL